MTTITAYYTNHFGLEGFDPETGTWTGIAWDMKGQNTPLSGGDGDKILQPGDEVIISSWNEFYTGWKFEGGLILYDPDFDYEGSPLPPYTLITNADTIPTSGQAEWGTYTFCFARGTLIATPEGDVPIEQLSIGDPVLTATGETVPVKWIGRQTLHTQFARLTGALPICISAGALGDGLPRRDLYVSPDHALFVDGLLVQAQALVNGASIKRAHAWPQENLEYFHIELENHDLVIAEGTAAETYVDNASRSRFDNYAEYVALFGEESPIPELSLPRVKNRRQLPTRIRKRLQDIALQSRGAIAA